MIIEKSKNNGIYNLLNNGIYTPFSIVSLSEYGTLFLTNRDVVTAFFNGIKRNEALKLMEDLNIKVIDERIK
jgi:hypothetical protein